LGDPIRESGPHLAGLLVDALNGDGPLYRLLADALKRAIDRGEIPLGTVLPPERALARSLSVSRATVVSAYDRLKGERWLDSRQGSGTWVRTPDAAEGPTTVDAISTARLFLSDSGQEQRSGPGETTLEERDVLDLSVAAVTANATVNGILASLTPQEIQPLTEHHGYLPQGLRALRQQIADRFASTGLPTGHDHVVITTGAHQAIALISRQTLQPGDTVLVESPTFPGALDVFRRFGARMVPWPVDDHGARTDVLEDLLVRTQPKLIYLSPNFHNPTGTVLPLERRQEIARLAAEHGTVVLEDQAMGDVNIDGVELPPSIASLDRTATVHTIGSTAKLFWAGLRVGWVRSPDDWAVRMLATKTVADLGTPLVSQLLALKLLRAHEQVLRERQAELGRSRDLVCSLLNEHLPDWEWRRPAGGLSIWARLPQGNADELAEVAMRNGVAIVPGPSLSVDEGNRRSLRIVFARPEPVLIEGLRRLTVAWASYAPTTDRSAARLLV
jgi:DNA-binding transcriptional MocR family regulator